VARVAANDGPRLNASPKRSPPSLAPYCCARAFRPALARWHLVRTLRRGRRVSPAGSCSVGLRAFGLQKSRHDMAAAQRERLRNRRLNETFSFVAADGLRYTATAAWFDDGRLGELFLGNHKSNSQADTNARDAAIVLSIALQYGADLDVIRRALCRDSHGCPSGVLGAALDHLAAGQG
jgi:hypothetical protein